MNRSWTEPKEKSGFATLTNRTERKVRFQPNKRTRSERKFRFHGIHELETNPEWHRAAVLKTADFSYTIAEIYLRPIFADCFSNYRDLKEESFQNLKWIWALMPNLTRSRSSTLNERNRTRSSANQILTNGTELKVPLQKVSEPTRNRREISLILRFPKSSPNCTNERPALVRATPLLYLVSSWWLMVDGMVDGWCFWFLMFRFHGRSKPWRIKLASISIALITWLTRLACIFNTD